MITKSKDLVIISTRLKKNKKNYKKKEQEEIEKEEQEEQEEIQKEEQEKKQQEETITDANVFNEQINKEEKSIKNKLFKKHFNFQNPSVMLKSLKDINDIEKNNKLVDVIISGLKDLKK